MYINSNQHYIFVVEEKGNTVLVSFCRSELSPVSSDKCEEALALGALGQENIRS